MAFLTPKISAIGIGIIWGIISIFLTVILVFTVQPPIWITVTLLLPNFLSVYLQHTILSFLDSAIPKTIIDLALPLIISVGICVIVKQAWQFLHRQTTPGI